MKINGFEVGVCSWSLRPKDMGDLVELLRQVGLDHVQLALPGLAAADEPAREAELRVLRDAGIRVQAGMMGFPGEDYSTINAIKKTGGLVPDDDWPRRKEVALACGRGAQRMGLKLLSGHLGFIPPSSHESYRMMVNRVCEVSEAFAAMGLELLMETGQETASELLQFLNDVPARNVGVNFDPANMILYGAGDPIEAIRVLGRHIRHVHVKDAIMSDQPGIKWGQEVPFGTGQVNPARFLAALRQAGYAGALAIEREAGNDRVGDVKRAIGALKGAG